MWWGACFMLFKTQAKICGTQWGLKAPWTLDIYCISAVQLRQQMGLDASWWSAEEYLATVLSPVVNGKEKLSHCLTRHHTIKACGVSDQPHILDTPCFTKESPLSERVSPIRLIFNSKFFLDFLTLENELIGCHQMTITNHQPTLFKSPEK